MTLDEGGGGVLQVRQLLKGGGLSLNILPIQGKSNEDVKNSTGK